MNQTAYRPGAIAWTGLLWMLLAAGCATDDGRTKGGGLEPFAEAGATEKSAEGDRYALVVGIERFEDDAFTDLKFAVDDARAVGDALSGFDRVLRRTNPERTDRSDLLAAVERLGRLASDRRDVAFVYVSTHGTLAREPGGSLGRYLVAHDTKLDVAGSTGIRVADLLDRLESFGSRRTALVLATCHSGSGKSKISDELSEALARRKSSGPPPLRRVSEATIMLSAAAFEEPAREDPTLNHDIYTYFFLEALRRGDRDGNGAVTVSEAHDYARRRTYGYTDGAQRPTAWSSILGRDPIILAGEPKRSGKPVVYSYQRSADGLSMSVDGQTKGKLPGGIALEPGRHQVALTESRTGETVWRGSLRLAPGDRMEVSELIPPPATWEFRIAGAGFGPLGSATRSRHLPASGGLGFRASRLRFPWPHSFVELRGLAFRTRGNLSAFGTDLEFEVRGGHLQVGAGGVWQIARRFDLEVGADIGFLWASRSFPRPNYSNPDRIRAPTAAGFASATWKFLDHARLGIRGDLGAFRARLGSALEIHPYADVRVTAGVGF